MEALCIRPFATNPTVIPQSRKLQNQPNTIRAKRLDLLEKINYRRSYWASWRENRTGVMSLCWVRARSSDHEESAQVFEQEALVEGSTLNTVAGGVEATLNDLSKWLVCILFVGTILWRHDTGALWATVGNGINIGLSITLKKILNHERPTSTLRSDPGMPSSHAQSIFYIVTFLTLSLVEVYGINGQIIALSGIFFITGSYFSWLRVSQRLHTVSQVMVGAILGSVFCIFWVGSWNAFVVDLFVSSLWVKLVVVLGAIGLGGGFVYGVFQSWIMDEK